MYEKLVPEIRDDPENVGYANMTDAEVAASLNAETKSKLRPLSSAELLAWSGQAGRLGKIEAAQTCNDTPPTVRTIAKVTYLMIQRSDTRLDLNLPDRNAMFDALVQADVLTANEKAELVAMATVSISRAEEVGLPHVDVGNVLSAMEMLKKKGEVVR